MRINIANLSGPNFGTVIVKPLPPLDNINEKLSLDNFAVSKSTVTPFEDFVISWQVSARTANVDVDDYTFRIKTHYDTLSFDAGSSGTLSAEIYRQTLITIQGKFSGSGNWQTLGSPIPMLIDESTCEVKDIPGNLIDAFFTDEVESNLSEIPQLRLRRDVEATWHTNHIRYKIPIEIVLDNFFNGDLDITFKVYFSVDYDDSSDCHFEVMVTESSDANFHWLEDLLTLGHTATIAATIERLLPVILKPITDRAERGFVNGICAILGFGNYFDTHQMLEVNIVPNNSFNHLNFVFCEKTTQ